jgi:GTP cyclohydrolase I
MSKPSKESAIKAIETLLEYIGADINSEHFKDTAQRVINSYSEIYKGYSKDIHQILNSKVYDQCAFQDVILLKNIEFNSVCAHHMLPIVGKASVSYIPNNKIVGISKIVKVVNMFAKRLQIQENMTAEIAENIQQHLNPLGTAVKVSATHYCMVMRGVQQKNTIMDTYHFTGIFNENKQYRQDFINCLINV